MWKSSWCGWDLWFKIIIFKRMCSLRFYCSSKIFTWTEIAQRKPPHFNMYPWATLSLRNANWSVGVSWPREEEYCTVDLKSTAGVTASVWGMTLTWKWKLTLAAPHQPKNPRHPLNREECVHSLGHSHTHTHTIYYSAECVWVSSRDVVWR